MFSFLSACLVLSECFLTWLQDPPFHCLAIILWQVLWPDCHHYCMWRHYLYIFKIFPNCLERLIHSPRIQDFLQISNSVPYPGELYLVNKWLPLHSCSCPCLCEKCGADSKWMRGLSWPLMLSFSRFSESSLSFRFLAHCINSLFCKYCLSFDLPIS